MSGPIVRSGPSPEFSKNWENVFGKKSPTEKPQTKAEPPAKKPAKSKKK